MNPFQLKYGTICIIFAMIISMTMGFEESQDDSNSRLNEDTEFELPRARSHTFLRTMISDDNAISQNDDSINQHQTFIRRDSTNRTHYKDRKGRMCVLCKWEFLPCCEPNLCQQHRIRFNECIEIKNK